jgi:DNA-binding transcriptional ArsR family regulator
MSLGDGRTGEPEPPADRGQATMRAMAHPVRLRILSLLTGAPLTAAEVARELGLTHANASYHLRTLLAGGLIVPAGEEKIRGGVAKRYRYDAGRDEEADHRRPPRSAGEIRALYAAAAHELIRRSTQGDWTARKSMTDAELWIDPDTWEELRERMTRLSRDLHAAALPPRTPGAVRTSTTMAMFRMEDDS